MPNARIAYIIFLNKGSRSSAQAAGKKTGDGGSTGARSAIVNRFGEHDTPSALGSTTYAANRPLPCSFEPASKPDHRTGAATFARGL